MSIVIGTNSIGQYGVAIFPIMHDTPFTLSGVTYEPAVIWSFSYKRGLAHVIKDILCRCIGGRVVENFIDEIPAADGENAIAAVKILACALSLTRADGKIMSSAAELPPPAHGKFALDEDIFMMITRDGINV